jgi:ATP synthase I chain
MTVAICLGFGLILAGYKPFGKGLVLGAVFSVLNFVLIATFLPTRAGKSGKGLFFSIFGSILVRFAFMAIPLVVSVKFSQFNVFAVIPGLLMVQIVILSDHLGGRWTHTFTQQPE